jgi:hypothetical protein
MRLPACLRSVPAETMLSKAPCDRCVRTWTCLCCGSCFTKARPGHLMQGRRGRVPTVMA